MQAQGLVQGCARGQVQGWAQGQVQGHFPSTAQEQEAAGWQALAESRDASAAAGLPVDGEPSPLAIEVQQGGVGPAVVCGTWMHWTEQRNRRRQGGPGTGPVHHLLG